jgi:hypothetical protein
MNIHRFTRFHIIIIAAFAVVSCKGKVDGRPSKYGSLMLKISFKPAFTEPSETILTRSDSEKSIQILLRDQLSADAKQDSFWFRKIYLSDQQFTDLDSTLISPCKQKISDKNTLKGVDGMNISTLLTIGGDTNFIHLWSPLRNEDSIGYQFTETLLTVLKRTFQDTLANEYFTELEEYIDASKWHSADPKRKIDQIRMKKYGWRIRKKAPN